MNPFIPKDFIKFPIVENDISGLSNIDIEILSDLGLPVIKTLNSIYFSPNSELSVEQMFDGKNYVVLGCPIYHEFDDSKICLSLENNQIWLVSNNLKFTEFVNENLSKFVHILLKFYSFYIENDLDIVESPLHIKNNLVVLLNELKQIDSLAFDNNKSFWSEKYLDLLFWSQSVNG